MSGEERARAFDPGGDAGGELLVVVLLVVGLLALGWVSGLAGPLALAAAAAGLWPLHRLWPVGRRRAAGWALGAAATTAAIETLELELGPAWGGALALDLALVAWVLAWRDPRHVLARARAARSPTERRALLARGRRLRPDQAPPAWRAGAAPEEPALPDDEAALSARLDELMALRDRWREPAPETAGRVVREGAREAAGVLAFTLPPLAFVSLWLPAGQGYLLLHAGAALLLAWGALAVLLERATSPLGPRVRGVGAAVGVVVVVALAGGLLGAGLGVARGGAFDPRVPVMGAVALARSQLGAGRASVELVGLGVVLPLVVWVGLVRAWPLRRGPGGRLGEALAGTSWFMGAYAIFVVDALWPLLPFSRLSSGGTWVLGAAHAFAACLAFAGLDLARRRRRRGIQRTIACERRRIVAALVRVREERVRQEGQGP